MKPANKKKEIKVTIFLDFTLLDKTFSLLSNTETPLLEDFPQLEFLKAFNFQSPLLGIFFSKDEYDQYLKPSLSFGDVKDNDKNESQIDFVTFIQLLLNREGPKKHILLRSSFLERLNEKNAYLIKEIFDSSGFNFKFKIVVENLFTLLVKDFTSLFYQIPLNFRFTKIEPFLQNLFKNKAKNFVNGMQVLIDVFDKDNVTLLYDENYPNEKFSSIFYKNIGVPEPKEEMSLLFNEINPLFMDYIREELTSNGDNFDVREESKAIKKISDKFKLKSPPLLKELSTESIDFLEELNKKIENLASATEKPRKKFFIINSETCNLRKIIPYIDGK